MKNILIIISLFFIVGCGSGDKVNTEIETEQSNLEYIIVSQDTYDRDNYSLIEFAKQIHKQGKAKILAIDVTGNDTNNKGGLIFSSILNEIDIPVLINQDINLKTRNTPSSKKYNIKLDEFTNDGLLDSQRPDSTLELVDILNKSNKKISYIVGGHLHNLESLIRYDIDLVKNKIKSVIIVFGGNIDNKKPEMNLSEGTYKETGTSKAANYVLKNLPSEVELIYIPVDGYKDNNLVIDNIKNNELKYFLINGTYLGKPVRLGDTAALVYPIANPTWFNNKWFNKRKVCLESTKYGSIYEVNGECNSNHYYLDNVDYGLVKNIIEEFIY